MLVDKDISASVRREGLLWIIDFLKIPFKPKNPIRIEPKFNTAHGPQLFFHLEQPSNMISVVDPNIGDAFYAVPSFSLNNGVEGFRKYPDFDIYPSVQGIGIGPKSDGLEIDASNKGVELHYKGRGLYLTRDVDAIRDLKKFEKGDDLLEPFDVRGWARGGVKYQVRDIEKLLLIVSKANKHNVNLARLELARYYAANGYGAEAIGILRVIEASKNNLNEEAAFYAVRGIANFLMKRYSEAVKDFGHKGLKDNPEAKLWKNASLVAEAKYPKKYYQDMINNAGFIKDYSPELKVPLALIGAKASVDAADDLAAQNFLELAFDKNALSNKKAEYYYHKAGWSVNTGNLMAAVSEYKNAEAANSRKFSAMAKRDRLVLLYRLGKLPVDKAIEEFERLRYYWRGDDFEYSVLTNLADFYIDKDDYTKVLRLLNEVDKIYEGREEAKLAKERMAKLFAELYVGGKADNMPPIKAIALFEEFRHLVPKGDMGNQMIRKLADRLIAVDLLVRAEHLIENQIVANSFSTEEKARMGAKLSLIYLMDEKPEEALAALKQSHEDHISDELKFQRKRLKARALADINEIDDAIELIGSEQDKTTLLLKTEIYWKAKKWAEAADTIRELIERPKVNKPIGDEQAQLVIDWATALKLAGRDTVLVRLRKNFLPYFKGTKYSDAFNLLTMDLEDSHINTKSLDLMVEQAEGFKSFIGSYNL